MGSAAITAVRSRSYSTVTIRSVYGWRFYALRGFGVHSERSGSRSGSHAGCCKNPALSRPCAHARQIEITLAARRKGGRVTSLPYANLTSNYTNALLGT